MSTGGSLWFLAVYCVLGTFCKELYLITTPNSLLSEAAHKFNIYVSVDTALVIETVHLKSNITNRTEIFVVKKGHQSIPYSVPFIGRHLGFSIKLRFLGDNCSSIDECHSLAIVRGTFINETREIDLLTDNFIIFSETDKPIYKPGDTIKLRAMALYPTNLLLTPPYDGTYNEILLTNGKYDSVPALRKPRTNFDSITIETPDNVKMAMWHNVSFAEAMNLSFRLSNDPIFGQWKMLTLLGTQKEQATFTVKKYVLPRFVVTVEPPKVILMTDKAIQFKVCATYSTGNNMQALIRGQLCLRTIRSICHAFAGQLNGTAKCAAITVNSTVFGLGNVSQRIYSSPATINVTVTENGTTLEVSRKAIGSDVKQSEYQIKFTSKDYFKPNLPYFGKLKLVRYDGKVQNGTRVLISCSANLWGFEQNYTSNRAGIIDFIIPFIPIHSRLSIVAYGEETTNSSLMISPTTYHSISNWESVDNEYIQISPLTTRIKCPGRIQLKVLMNADVSSTILYAQMLSRGVINKMIEYKPVPVKCTDRNDYVGHYQCVSNGKLKCLDGWKGGNCREPICIDGCNNGACLRPNYCSCKVGWAGKSCDTCLRASYCVNGVCKYGNDCQCLKEWTGYKCDIKAPKVHLYKEPIIEVMTTIAPIPEPQFQTQTVFERFIDLDLDKNMGPDLHIVVYYINANNEVVADSLEINKKLSNCSHLGRGKFRFNTESSTPGAIVKLSLDPGTVERRCALRISDVALSQFGQSSNINLAYLINKLITMTHQITRENMRGLGSSVCYKESRSKRRALDYYPGLGRGFDSRKSFARSGLTVATNARIVNAKCRTLLGRGGIQVQYDSMPSASKKTLMTNERSQQVKDVVEVKKQIREFFPESWVFAYYNDTPTQFNLTVPDSMTKWKANSFCMTEKGVWISQSRYLTVELPFFADIYLPYSIKMDETLPLPVKLFNYVDECYEIKAELSVNVSEIQITGPRSFTVCVCAKDVKTIYFNIKAKIMGKLNVTVTAKSQYSSFCSSGAKGTTSVTLSDSIRRQLLVEAPGIQTDTTLSEMICNNNNETIGLKSVFHIPNTIVPGSLRTYLVYNGDVMGQTFDNLDRLVNMPYGCGEQNMVAFVPSIYVMDYMTSLKINDSELINKAKKYIVDGYQRQLTYKHDDGSYSAFGKADKSGNTWLTAFVLKSFTDASKYVGSAIDKNLLRESIVYLEKMQLANGCFNETGQLLSNNMAGGLKEKGKTDEGLLTAYVLISLGHTKLTKTTFNISKAVACVKSGLKEGVSSSYRLALSGYALSIHDPQNVAPILEQLQNLSVTEGRYRYWKSGLFNNPTNSYVGINSADVETTGYALLALHKIQTVSQSLATIYWLSNQRNRLGGYYSTQDTIVALNAVSVVAEQLGTSTAFKQIALEIMLDNNANHHGLLTNDNRLVTTKINMGSQNVSYIDIKTMGTGCISLQLISLYNIEKLYSAKEEFKITVTAVLTNRKVCTTLEIVVCSSYLRKDRNSNMILITIDFPSGWEQTNDEKNELSAQIIAPLKRIDFLKNKMHLYYDSFSYAEDNNERCFTSRLIETSKVDNLKAAFVRMVDYYKPEIYTDTSYEVPMSTCDIKNVTKPKPREILCPKCVNDSTQSVIDLIGNICPWSFLGMVQATTNHTTKQRTFYEPKYGLFYEWTVDLESITCPCLQSWPHLNQDFVVLSSDWQYIQETLTLTNTTTLYPINVLYKAYTADLINSCTMAKQLATMMTRLSPSFSNETAPSNDNSTCPSCIMLSTLYYKVTNISQFICANQVRWSLSIDAIKNSSSTIIGSLSSNQRNDSIKVNVSLPMDTCFCWAQLQNLAKRFDIIDNGELLLPNKGKSNEEPISLLLDDKFTIVESSVFMNYKTIQCKK